MSAQILPDGSIYSGAWASDRCTPQGLGIRLYLNGRLYVGEWDNGVMHGKGILLVETGDLFEGHFSCGAFHGRGFLYSRADDRAKRGVWKHGALLSVEDIVGNVDDANLATEFRPVAGASRTSHTTPQFKLMELQAITATMRELRQQIELPPHLKGQQLPQQEQHQQRQQPNHSDDSFTAFSNAIAAVASGGNINEPVPAFPSAISKIDQADHLAYVAHHSNIHHHQHNHHHEPAHHEGDQQLIFSNQLMLTISGPSYNHKFSFMRFVRFFAMFLFPFLSLPHLGFCPLRVDGIELEREYVVSGAALRADFEIPSWEIYFAAIGIVFSVVAAIVPHGVSAVLSFTVFSRSDIIVPFALCILFALLQAAYQSFHRTAHALERLDRHHFPRLAALSAQCIDAHCHTLVVSWDEEGLGRVFNRKYHYKWGIIAGIYGFLLAFASPLTRLIIGFEAFAEPGDLTNVSAILSFLCVWIISSGITYDLCRLVDLERQLEESMTVITRCAYLQGQSIMRPSEARKFKFHLDADFSLEHTSQGFLGWYITRSFVLYASTLSNHRSRHAFISVLCLALVAIDIAFIVETLRSIQRGEIRFTSAHMFGAVASVGWGSMLMYYLNVTKNMYSESKTHLYLIDVARMFHSFRDARSSDIISRCRGMVSEHDYASKVLGLEVTDKVMALWACFHCFAVSCIALSFTMWALTLRGDYSTLLNMRNMTIL